MIGSTIFEVGKKKWIWGKGFSYSPTYTLNNKQEYWGNELSWLFNNSTLNFGTALKDDNLQSSWLKLNSLLLTSDYTLILSYLKDNSEIKENNNYNQRKKEDGISLGFNYSKDFLNGLEIHGGANLYYWDNLSDTNSHYLLGSEYITSKNRMIILEYYHKEDNYLTISLGNQGDSFSNFSWQLRETINLDDKGEIRNLYLSYTGFDNLTPSIDISNFAGPSNSKIKSKPKDWTIKFKMSTTIF